MLPLLSDRKVGRGVFDVSKHLQRVGRGLHVGIEGERSEITLIQRLLALIVVE